jgi:hypothetical protein
MGLLNYSTQISAEKTAGEIAVLLARAGASQILTDYRDGKAVGLSFAVPYDGQVLNYRLPVDPGPVLGVFNRQRIAPKFRTLSQAERTAWRIVKVWIEAQLAIVETRMVSLPEVMLPYMLTPNYDDDGRQQTVYQYYLNSQLAIGTGS